MGSQGSRTGPQGGNGVTGSDGVLGRLRGHREVIESQGSGKGS